MSSRPFRRLPLALAMGIGGLLLVPLLAPAQDAARGRLLYETHCGGCHDARVHQRLRSEIRDLADLRDAVARWAPHSRRKYSRDELEQLTAYINEQHYRFGLPPKKQ